MHHFGQMLFGKRGERGDFSFRLFLAIKEWLGYKTSVLLFVKHFQWESCKMTDLQRTFYIEEDYIEVDVLDML